MDDELPPIAPVPPGLIVVAYLLALTCALVPLGILLAGFAALVLVRRGQPAHGLGVLAVAVTATAFGIFVLA
jgi:hypothetical protein